MAVDIGATNVKFCHVDIHGDMLETPRRRPTPYPCSPDRLIEALDERIETSECLRVGIGFPGEFIDGHVVRPGNLSRPGGVTTDVDPGLESQWRGFELQDELCKATGRDVRIVNDATLAALGSIDGHGVELVLTLGTGLGIALAIDGTLRKIRDVGAEVFVRGKTYDQTIGEHSARDRRRTLGRTVGDGGRWFRTRVRGDDGPPGRRERPTGGADLVRQYRLPRGDQRQPGLDPRGRQTLLQLSEVDRALREYSRQYPTSAVLHLEVGAVVHPARPVGVGAADEHVTTGNPIQKLRDVVTRGE